MSSPDLITSYLTYYVRSLGERSRVEKTGTKYGVDWIIYNLALAEDLTPLRLPFLRAGGDAMSKTKTEGEFGVDLAFLSPDRSELRVFVLKDEALTTATWRSENFDPDLRAAVNVNLTDKGLENVRTVRVILAYNKDEDANGTKLFDNLAHAIGTKVGDHAALVVERWNLTEIVERVKRSLLNPSLLPQSFFSLFNYISAQVADMVHDSESWRQHVVPVWRRFLDDLLAGEPSERAVKLVPVALLILTQHGEKNASFATGYIDLVEWAMLKLWSVYARAADKKHATVREVISRAWQDFYVAHLKDFYQRQTPTLITENALSVCGPSVKYLGALGASYIALWHVGRLGILTMALGELPLVARNAPSADIAAPSAAVPPRTPVQAAANLLAGLISNNPAALRPMLDIHHLELFLVWDALRQAGRDRDMVGWLQQLEQRLAVRRGGFLPLPFLEGHSLLERVFEQAVVGKKPADFMDKSSYLLTMLLELCFSIQLDADRDELIGRIVRHLVWNVDDSGESFGAAPLNLVSWQPPPDWSPRVLEQRVASGVGIAIQLSDSLDSSEHAASIAGSVTRSRQPLTLCEGIPKSVYLLACLKYSSPLPPEFWREAIFPEPEAAQQ
jgi:hypothetical protein